MSDVMIDLETLGNGPNATIIALGAQRFKPETGELLKTFYRRVDWASAMLSGKTDASTLQWWFQQNEEARLEVIKPGDPLSQVLDDFDDWFVQGEKVWGNGACFDITILQNAFLSHEMDTPWKFFNVRDVRTISDLASHLIVRDSVPFTGVKHNALSDATWQAQYVSKMYQALKGIKNG